MSFPTWKNRTNVWKFLRTWPVTAQVKMKMIRVVDHCGGCPVEHLTLLSAPRRLLPVHRRDLLPRLSLCSHWLDMLRTRHSSDVSGAMLGPVSGATVALTNHQQRDERRKCEPVVNKYEQEQRIKAQTAANQFISTFEEFQRPTLLYVTILRQWCNWITVVHTVFGGRVVPVYFGGILVSYLLEVSHLLISSTNTERLYLQFIVLLILRSYQTIANQS